MHKVFVTFGKLITLGIVIVAMAIFLLNVDRISSISFKKKEDRSNYAVVAKTFVSKNGFIAKKIGKVVSLSHVGKGGVSGGKSFNVFKVSGEDRNAICNITVEIDNNKEWFVTSADILTGGKTFTIPVKRSAGDDFKTFKLK